jgi:hypothetical protein
LNTSRLKFKEEVFYIVEKLGFATLQDAMESLYREHRSSLKIARILRRSPSTIQRWVAAAGIAPRKRGGAKKCKRGVFYCKNRVYVAATVLEDCVFEGIRCVDCNTIIEEGPIHHDDVLEAVESHRCHEA